MTGDDEGAQPGATLGEWVEWAQAELERAALCYGHGTDNAFDEAVWLVSYAAGITPAEAASAWGRVLGPTERRGARDLISQRIATRRPTAYLINEAWFAGRRYYVDERVLVPRSHLGEWIEDQFAPWLDPARTGRILDLCTGSGCVAVACALAFPEAAVDASDISMDALNVARLNVARHGVGQRVRLIESDLFAALRAERYDLIVSNPPYVSQRDMETLPAEYRHEPSAALAGGHDGLIIVERILREALSVLTDDGSLVVEVGAAARTLEQRYPRVPFTWLSATDGTTPLLLLTAKQLEQHAAELCR